VWDIVPADLVASSILAAAAAVSAGAAAAISHATQAGVVKGLAEDRRVVLGYPHPFAAAATASHALLCSRSGSQSDVTAKIVTAKIMTKAQKADAEGPASPDVPLQQGRDQQPCPALSSEVDSPLLRAGPPQPAVAPVHDSRSSSVANSTVCESDAQQLRQQHGGVPLLVVHAATSSTYPLVLMEGWNYMCDFLDAHPPPFRYVQRSPLGRTHRVIAGLFAESDEQRSACACRKNSAVRSACLCLCADDHVKCLGFSLWLAG
jgi:hypothetical protein